MERYCPRSLDRRKNTVFCHQADTVTALNSLPGELMSSDINCHVFLSLFFISRRILKSFWTDRCFCKRPDRLVSPTSTVSKRRRAELTILKHLLWHCRLFYIQVKPGDKVSAPNFPKAWFWTTKKEACNKKKIEAAPSDPQPTCQSQDIFYVSRNQQTTQQTNTLALCLFVTAVILTQIKQW